LVVRTIFLTDLEKKSFDNILKKKKKKKKKKKNKVGRATL